MIPIRLFKKHQRAAILLAVVLALFSVTGALATAGALDPTFGTGGIVTTDFSGRRDGISAIQIQPDGKIVAVGCSVHLGTECDFGLARYNVDGSLDKAFGVGGKVVTKFSNNSDGASSVAIQSDGKLVVGGSSIANSTSPYFGDPTYALARYNRDGSLDTTFGTKGKVITSFGGSQAWLHGLAIQPDGKIVAVGTAVTPESIYSKFALARYNHDGSLDLSFGNRGKITTAFSSNDPNNSSKGYAVVLQPDGKIIMAGFANNFSAGFALARYNPDGSLDKNFGNNGKVTTGNGGEAEAVILQPNGKIVAAGYRGLGSGSGEFVLVRYNANGSLDTDFGTQGMVTTAFEGGEALGRAAVLQPNGKIIVAGSNYHEDLSYAEFALARYNQDGSLDPTFGSDGKITTFFGGYGGTGWAIALQRNGQIIMAGDANSNFALARYIGDCVIRSTGTYDGWILKSGETSGKGGSINAIATTFLLGDDALDRQYRAILSFDTKVIPKTAIIRSAMLQIKQYGNPVGSNPFNILGSLLVDIRKGPFGKFYALTANDFEDLATTTKVAAFNKTPFNGWYSAWLNLPGRNNINKGGITQFRLYFAKDDNDNMNADYMGFLSGENSAASNRPQLIITYTVP